MMNIKIAIDGPAGAGKSTVARMVAQRLNYKYIDTGAMYRAITLAAIRSGISTSDTESMEKLAKSCELEILVGNNNENKIYLNGNDVSSEIRRESISAQVSDVSSQLMVRKILVEKQRQMSAKGGVVLDGRDIGTIVLPSAELKIYLTASLTVRAERRYLELNKDVDKISLADLTTAIQTRDSKDANNIHGPMRPAADAIAIDTDNLTIEEVVDKIVALARARIKR